MPTSLLLALFLATPSLADEPPVADPAPVVEEAPAFRTVREAYGGAWGGAAFFGGTPVATIGARGGGDLVPWLHMGGEGYGAFLLDPFLSFTWGGNYFEIYTMPAKRFCPVIDLAPSFGFATGQGFHFFFAPRAGLRLDFAVTPWLALSPGVHFRGSVPIVYDEEVLGWALNDLQTFGFDLMIKTAPKWLKQAKAGNNAW